MLGRFGKTYTIRISNHPLCLVKSLWRTFGSAVSHENGYLRLTNPQKPLFQSRGRPIPRANVVNVVKTIAILSGVAPKYAGSHSLRAGGICALHAAGYDLKKIRSHAMFAIDSRVPLIYIGDSASVIPDFVSHMADAPPDVIDYARLQSIMHTQDPNEPFRPH